MSNVTKIVLDCDPGHDDAFAILLAAFHPNIDLLAISVCSGNLSSVACTRNTLKMLSVIGKEHIPVRMGAASPLYRDPKYCPEIHGTTGLDTVDAYGGVQWPDIEEKLKDAVDNIGDRSVVNFMYSVLKKETLASGKKPVLVATGALTNVAALLFAHPDVVNYIEEIVLMGGSCGKGNTGPVSEFNIEVDPEAASFVLGHKLAKSLQVTMVPLDVTHTALATPEVLTCIAQGGNDVTKPPVDPASIGLSTGAGASAVTATAVSPFRKLMTSLLMFFAASYKEWCGFDSPPLHDPCAVLYVVERDAFVGKKCHVSVETQNPHSVGQTIVDLINWNNRRTGDDLNVNVALEMDVTRFWNRMLEAITAADKVSCLNKQ